MVFEGENKNSREEIYSSIRNDLTRNFYITIGVANNYHSKKRFYRTQEGIEKLTEDMKEQIHNEDEFEIYTLKKGKETISDKVFNTIKDDFVESLDFIIRSLENKLNNYKENLNLKEENQNENTEMAYVEIIGSLNSFRKYVKINSLNSKNTINNLYDKFKEIEEKYSKKEKIKIN